MHILKNYRKWEEQNFIKSERHLTRPHETSSSTRSHFDEPYAKKIIELDKTLNALSEDAIPVKGAI